MKKKLLTALMIGSIAGSCNYNPVDESGVPYEMRDLIVDENFSFNTTKACSLKIFVQTNTGDALEMVRVNVLVDLGSGYATIQSLASDHSGHIDAFFQVPSFADTLVLQTDYIGLPEAVKLAYSGERIEYDYGPKVLAKSKELLESDPVEIVVGSTTIRTMSGFSLLGVPENLEPSDDDIDPNMLADINASLPERQAVPVHNPEYLAATAETNIILEEKAEVWVTFVHEGAGNKNSLGYYVYDRYNPPSTPSDIEEINIIFPNTSFLNSGGGLVSGNKVKLGTFEADQTIGWVCIADGFRNNTITKGSFIFYSDPALNPETDSTFRQHNVLLYDHSRKKVLLGFEDLKRGPSSDEDFNDIVFYVTSNPITAIENENYPKMENTGEDRDGDGITDNFDDYPDDEEKAFDNYFPAEDHFGTLAYEDLWPSQGDYDLNDIVIDYQFNQVTNATNEVVQIDGKIVLKAMGCSFHNGFGIAWPFSPGMVDSASGNLLTRGIIDLAENGLENEQNQAVFMVFDDGFSVLPYEGNMGIGVNTNPEAPYVIPDTLNISVVLNQPLQASEAGLPPYNPFIFVNGDRSREVHLPDMQPTQLGGSSWLNTEDDTSDPLSGRTYRTSNNLPWALNVVTGFDHPVEKCEITHAYAHFASWALSAGSAYNNWYLEIQGYRNNDLVYSPKP